MSADKYQILMFGFSCICIITILAMLVAETGEFGLCPEKSKTSMACSSCNPVASPATANVAENAALNPLEQFNISVLFTCGCDVALLVTNLLVVFFLLLGFLYVVFFVPLLFGSVTSNLYHVLFSFYSFVLGLFNNQLAKAGAKKFFFYFFLCFVFVLGANFLGILPYNFTITSHFIQTFGLSFSSFVGIFILGFVNFKTGFFQLFVPKNVPALLVPFLVVLEIISYMIRPLSLSIRLFANMLAGHILMHILLSFNFFMLKKKLFLVFFFSLIVLFLIFTLEFCIVFIQAYVFLTLLLIYFSDSFQLH
jgi:ATP synthase subunit 6